MRIVLSILCFLNIAFAKDKVEKKETSKATLTKPANIKNSIEFFKRFDSVDQAYQIMSGLYPTVGLDRWIQYFQANKMDLKKLTFKDIRVESNQVFFPNLKTPIIFTNDQKLMYKGIAFKFTKDQTPEQNMDRLKKAWGAYPELGLSHYSKTSRWLFLIERTYAEDKTAPEDPRDTAAMPAVILYELFSGFLPEESGGPEKKITSDSDILGGKVPEVICNEDGTFKNIVDEGTRTEIPLTMFVPTIYKTEAQAKEELNFICTVRKFLPNLWKKAMRALSMTYRQVNEGNTRISPNKPQQ